MVVVLLTVTLFVVAVIALATSHPSGPVTVVLALLLLVALFLNRRLYVRFSRQAAGAAAADARRRSFLADLTHELRTPLAIIRGEAEAIADGVHSPSAENLGRIVEAAAAVERLVADLGVLSAGEPAELELRKEEVDLELLVTDTAASLRGVADAAGVALEESVAPGLTANLDPVRIRGVLVNLLNNSIRHTPRGGRVTVAAAPSGEGIELTVRDTGSGIPAELLPNVFKRFVKDPASPGSGLGLAIAHDVVVAHGGRIEADSPPGEGALIRVWLPA
jgi:two-component system sensor histidine kinase BaeS